MKRFIPILLLVIPAVWAIITPGYFPIHDNTQVVRVAQMTNALKDLHFPVRWVKDLGYGFGYPIFNFYNPLPYYFGAAFNLLGLNALIATKLMFVFPVLLASVAMYKLISKYLGNLPGLVAAAFYTYAPYHAVQIYVRGSVAEYWAYALLPYVIYYFLEKKVIAAGIFLALLILSHNLSVIMIIPLLVIIFLIQLFNSKNKLNTLLIISYSLFLALSTSAFFWLPMIAEKSFTSVDAMVNQQFNPLDHFVFLRQLFSSPWGFAGSAPGPQDGLSFILGPWHIAFSILVLIFFKKIYQSKSSRLLLIFALCTYAFSLFMLTTLSKLIWANIPTLAFIQFPWRFLSLAAFAASILAALVFARFRTLQKAFLVYLFIGLFVLFSFSYFQPQFKFGSDINDKFLLSPERIKFEVSKRSDEYKPLGSSTPSSFDEVPQSRFIVALEAGESVEVLEDKTQKLQLVTNLQAEKTINFNIYSFPGWTLYIDDQKSNLLTTDQKLLSSQIPVGSHQVLLKLQNTQVRTIGNLITLLSLILLVTCPRLIKYFHR